MSNDPYVDAKQPPTEVGGRTKERIKLALIWIVGLVVAFYLASHLVIVG